MHCSGACINLPPYSKTMLKVGLYCCNKNYHRYDRNDVRVLVPGLLEDAANTTFAELGAGKAYLTLMIARATEACNFVINDNQTFKLKADRILRRFVRDNVKHTAFVRCQSDLKNFVIKGAIQELQTTAASASSAPHLHKTPWKVVGVGKHLCGGATDYALRSLVAFAAEQGTLQPFATAFFFVLEQSTSHMHWQDLVQ
jgi:Methyltransferase TRM13